MPHYDLFAFKSPTPPRPLERVPVRRDWLLRVAGSWVTEMPNDAMRLTAARGDLILCMPVGDLRDRKVYAFLLDGRPLIRAVELKADGLALVAENTAIDPITPTPEQLKQLTPIGLVVGSVKFHAV